MNMQTYANQKVVVIRKNLDVTNYLRIDNGDWMEAARALSDSAFKLYIYLASNNDGFRIALSQNAANKAIGISRSSYHRAVNELLDKGYMCCDHGNTYIFQTTQNEEWINEL